MLRFMAGLLVITGCYAGPKVVAVPTKNPDAVESVISALIPKLESELADDRAVAAADLVRLGHAALPSLRRRSSDAPPALKRELSAVIESIRCTDFLLMVRPEPWRITATLNTVGPEQAHRELFAQRPLHPKLGFRLLPLRGDRALRRASFELRDESYWTTVGAFSKAFSVHLDSFSGSGAEFEGGDSYRWSEPHGPCIVRADVTGTAEKPQLRVVIHLEPGFQPIQGNINNLVIRGTNDGMQVVSATAREDSWSVLTNDRTIPTPCELEVPLFVKGRVITISGTARVVLPTKVEGIAWTLKDWMETPVKDLAGCQITLKDLHDGWLKFSVRPTGVGDPDPERRYFDGAWVFLSDDAGRTSNTRAFGLFGTGYSENGGSPGWPHKETSFQRVCVIRPIGAEVIEFPFEIRDVQVIR